MPSPGARTRLLSVFNKALKESLTSGIPLVRPIYGVHRKQKAFRENGGRLSGVV